MRPTALVPVLCCVAALVLAFLCLFAGNKPGFMEDYNLITVNTSRIGQNLLNTTEQGSNPLSSLWKNITNSIESEINDKVGDLAEKVGVDDFYSVHLLDYCFGEYTPAPVANATLSSKDIHKNITGCSNRTAMYTFDPEAALERKLNETHTGVTLKDLNWPEDIQNGIKAVQILQRVVFVLYCISIAFILISLLFSLGGLFPSGRLTAFLNVMFAFLGFLAIGLASAIVTALIVKSANIINKYGNEIGVAAYRGGKFLAITWASTGLMLVVLLWWCFETCIGHRRQPRYVGKHG